MLVADRPSGFLTVSEVPAAQNLWMVATGTGVTELQEGDRVTLHVKSGAIVATRKR